MASTHRSAPRTVRAIPAPSSRPDSTVIPSASLCSSLPYSVATHTVTAAPSPARARDSRRPSVVPLNSTMFTGPASPRSPGG